MSKWEQDTKWWETREEMKLRRSNERKRQGTKIKRGRLRGWVYFSHFFTSLPVQLQVWFEHNSDVKLLAWYSLLKAHMGLKAIQYSGNETWHWMLRKGLYGSVNWILSHSESFHQKGLGPALCWKINTLSSGFFVFCFLIQTNLPRLLSLSFALLPTPSLYLFLFSFSAVLKLQTQNHLLFPSLFNLAVSA